MLVAGDCWLLGQLVISGFKCSPSKNEGLGTFWVFAEDIYLHVILLLQRCQLARFSLLILRNLCLGRALDSPYGQLYGHFWLPSSNFCLLQAQIF